MAATNDVGGDLEELDMNAIYTNSGVGRKNILFGIALFLLLGVAVGIPLTVDFFGGSLLTSDQYQTWKVVHGYGVFLSFINWFFGMLIDRVDLARRQKEIASWSFLVAGLIGGIVRMALVLVSAMTEFGVYASLGETAFFILGTAAFVVGQVSRRIDRSAEPIEDARYSPAR
jgi:hypothetical protein